MNETILKYYLSNARFNTYLAKANNNFENACKLYKLNIELSEAFYPILSLIEISLRNTIHQTLSKHFCDFNWFENHLPNEFIVFVNEAKNKLKSQGKHITADRMIAELNFGFWNRLFNRNYTKLLWKPLRLMFKNMPKELRQRDAIADTLFRIRSLRNRIYHYEPIFGNVTDLESLNAEMITFLKWLDKDLPNFIIEIDRLAPILERLKRGH